MRKIVRIITLCVLTYVIFHYKQIDGPELNEHTLESSPTTLGHFLVDLTTKPQIHKWLTGSRTGFIFHRLVGR